MPKWILKLVAAFAKNPEESSNAVIYIVFGIISVFLMLGILCVDMVGGFFEQADFLNEDFDVAETEIYQDIKRVYEVFEEDMQKQMDEREAEIIEENTYYIPVENEDGTITQQAVCDVTVTKTFNHFSYAYILAYINHSTDVKKLEKYDFDDEEIYEVMEQICTMKEIHVENSYSLFTAILSPKDAAALFYPDEQTQEMYCLSYDLYGEFLAFADDSSQYETDAGANTPGNHKTSMSPDDIEDLIKNLPPDAELAKMVLEFAFSKLGYPYSQAKRHSGTHFDCSSLVYYAYLSGGLDVTYQGMTTAAAIAQLIVERGTVVDPDNLQPGDLVFWCFDGGNGRFMEIEHVGIYVGDGKVIDASYSKGYVVYRPLYSRGKIVLCGRPY